MEAQYCCKDIVMEVDDTVGEDVMDVDLADHMDVDSGDIEDFMSFQSNDTNIYKMHKTAPAVEHLGRNDYQVHIQSVNTENNNLNLQEKIMDNRETAENDQLKNNELSDCRNLKNNLFSSLFQGLSNEKTLDINISKATDGIMNQLIDNAKEKSENIYGTEEIGSSQELNKQCSVKFPLFQKVDSPQSAGISVEAMSEAKQNKANSSSDLCNLSKGKPNEDNETTSSEVNLIDQNKLKNTMAPVTDNLMNHSGHKQNSVPDLEQSSDKSNTCIISTNQFINQRNGLDESENNAIECATEEVENNSQSEKQSASSAGKIESALSRNNLVNNREESATNESSFEESESLINKKIVDSQSEELSLEGRDKSGPPKIESLLKDTFKKSETISSVDRSVNNDEATDRGLESNEVTENEFLLTVPALSDLARMVALKNNLSVDEPNLAKQKSGKKLFATSHKKEQKLTRKKKKPIRKKIISKSSDKSLNAKKNRECMRESRALDTPRIRLQRKNAEPEKVKKPIRRRKRARVSELVRSERLASMRSRTKQSKSAMNGQSRKLVVRRGIKDVKEKMSASQKRSFSRNTKLNLVERKARGSEVNKKSGPGLSRRSKRLDNKFTGRNSSSLEPPPQICEIYLESNFLEKNSNMFFNEDEEDDSVQTRNGKNSSRRLTRKRMNSPKSISLKKRRGNLPDCVVRLEKVPEIDRLLPAKKSPLDWDPNICYLCEPKRLFLSKTALASHVNVEHINNSFRTAVRAVARGGCDEDLSLPDVKQLEVKSQKEGTLSFGEDATVGVSTLGKGTVEDKTKLTNGAKGEESSLLYECSQCDRRFSTPAALGAHRKVHKYRRQKKIKERDPLSNESIQKKTSQEMTETEFSVETKSNHINGKIVLQFRRKISHRRQKTERRNLNNNNNDFADKMKSSYTDKYPDSKNKIRIKD